MVEEGLVLVQTGVVLCGWQLAARHLIAKEVIVYIGECVHCTVYRSNV